MCGIAGLVRKDNSIVEKDTIKKMTDTIVHRGPDAEGQFTFQNVGLGHRRLSILDLSEKGNQPMKSMDGSYIIVFNGEIYNYIELKQQLKELGASFYNDTDTEVIIEAYRYWGTDCVNYFNGMWAFVLFDKEKNLLFGSRDRAGVKPFVYLDREDVFAFGSEPKEILELYPDERKYNPTMIWRFLDGRPEDMDNITFYENIYQLEPAHSFIYNLSSHRIEKWEYWTIHSEAIYKERIQGKNVVSEFRKLLEDAVRVRLRSDVPLGSSLSGGLDSSTIVGIMNKKFDTKVNTFSSVYEDKDCNEKEYIDEVNSFIDANVNLVYPDDNDNLLEDFKKIAYHHDGPNSNASLYSGYSVYRKAQDTVKVLLDGQGADELLGGYLGSYNARLYDIVNQGTLRSKIQAMKTICIFNEEWPEKMNEISSDIIRLAMGKNGVKRIKYEKTKRFEKHQELFCQDFLKKANLQLPRCSGDVEGKLNENLYVQFRQTSLPTILHNVDGNSMAFSLEVRNPFLDYRLVEFCMALDGKYKIKNQWTKWILRKSCKEYLPKKIAERTNKMGFPAPFGRWLKEHPQNNEMKSLIFALGERGIVKKEVLQEYYRQHMENEIDRSGILYKFMTLELWLRMCID